MDDTFNIPAIPRYTLYTELVAVDRKIVAFQEEKAAYVVHIQLNERLNERMKVLLLKDDEECLTQIKNAKERLRRDEINLELLETLREEWIARIKKETQQIVTGIEPAIKTQTVEAPAPNGRAIKVKEQI